MFKKLYFVCLIGACFLFLGFVYSNFKDFNMLANAVNFVFFSMLFSKLHSMEKDIEKLRNLHKDDFGTNEKTGE